MRPSLTILDVGWEAGQLLATDCWLAEAVRTADQVVLVTTATVPGMRRASVALESAGQPLAARADHPRRARPAPQEVAPGSRARRRPRRTSRAGR
ncbi:hypothetical protein G5V59_18805 [Nocardioides sp. W3-2-3]|uniref:hypothetical protein n=1 Tax=Nocardioides convexus TaxID=2712224 RepID=UPI0024185768|nr:hypothetical protein [Nocardioides convexus]NHA01212.1 hypothetical protein [Nocardioides convexus]